MAARINLDDIAAKAGVSQATVSYALNGKAGVSEKTRKRIVAIAKTMGYRPDAELVALMAHISTRRSRGPVATLGIILDHGHPCPWETNPSVRAFLEGARKRASELGYNIETFWYSEPGLTPARLRSILLTRGIQGLMFSAGRGTAHLDFDISGFACAMSGLCYQSPKINYVVPHHFRNMMMVLERTYALGYRRPLLSLPGRAAGGTEHLMDAAYVYFCSMYADVQVLPIYTPPDYEQAPFKEFVNRYRPDVIVCTMGNWGDQFGKRVPREIGYVNLTWAPEEGHVAGLDRCLPEQASSVVDIVVAALHRRELGVPKIRKQISVDGRFMDGPTLPNRASAVSIQLRGSYRGK